MNSTERKKKYKFIIRGISSCIKSEQIAILKIILTHSPDIQVTNNRNGVFISLEDLNENTLRLIEKKIAYAIEQSKRENLREIEQRNLLREFNS